MNQTENRNLDVSQTIPVQRSAVDLLRVKLTNYRLYMIILLLLLFISVCMSVILLHIAYEDISTLEFELEQLPDENNSLESEVERLTIENNNLKSELSTLQSENFELETKASWLDESCKIIIADEGSLYKTYHTYDCEKWRGHSVWIYNKEQVINNSEYTKCQLCN